MQRTGIEWTDASWNPLRGCSRVSEGCRNCYAERMALRFGAPPKGPFKNVVNESGWNGQIELAEHKLTEPLSWKAPRRIFVNSMSDLFHEKVPDEWIAEIWRVMFKVQRHTYQVLTKRAERMAELTPRLVEVFGVLPNIWLGVSVEDQAAADERIPHLLRTPAAVRFLSVEPLLGPVRIGFRGQDSGYREKQRQRPVPESSILNPDPCLHWVIVGGESGPGARPMHPDWVRSIRDQCQAAGVPFFFKQWGEWAPLPELFDWSISEVGSNRSFVRVLRAFKRKHGAARLLDGRPEGWDAAMVRDGLPPDKGTMAMGLIGKKRAGRDLDGREWSEFPKQAVSA